jgi:hypothetical protein
LLPDTSLNGVLPGDPVLELLGLEDKAQLPAPSIDDEGLSTPAPFPAQRQKLLGIETLVLCDTRTTAEKVSSLEIPRGEPYGWSPLTNS